jgi:hypothetical protein
MTKLAAASTTAKRDLARVPQPLDGVLAVPSS